MESNNRTIAVLSSHTPSLFWFRMEMMLSFQQYGYKVFAVGNESESDWKEQFAKKGIVYKQIYVNRNGVNPIHDLKTLRTVNQVLREIRPDKVFTYQAKTVIYGGIAANQLGITEVYPLIAGMGSVFLKHDFKTNLIRRIMTAEYRLGMNRYLGNVESSKNKKSYCFTVPVSTSKSLSHFLFRILPPFCVSAA